MIDRVEETLDVGLDDPAALPECRPFLKLLQRLVRRATGSKAKRVRMKILLVDGFQQHRHRPLRDLILKSGDVDFTLHLLQ